MRQRISDALRQTVILQAKFLCEYCLVHEDDFYLSGEVDHISAIKHGGINELSNLAYSCIHCNRNKGTDEAIVVNGQAVRFFNPRVDRWSDHFELSGAIILPKTDIGTVTLNVLKINHEYRVQERLAYMAKGTYPHPNALGLLMPT